MESVGKEFYRAAISERADPEVHLKKYNNDSDHSRANPPLSPFFQKGELVPTALRPLFGKEGLGEICGRGGAKIVQQTSESPH